MSDPVSEQYEAYPYPARDPREEKSRLVIGSPSHPAELNHYLFAGGRDLGPPFRALVAGGGTGDAAIMLAQGLADAGGGEVVYLDLSRAAREIAESRAKARGLDNIRFETGSLLDLPGMDIGAFDYIDCCGVLHHLADPPAGLAALKSVLAPGGGMGLMVYAPYGRTGVYQMQEALRLMAADAPLKDRVALARRLLANLPESNWLKRNPFIGDHKRGDAELVDLFLHARDRPYTVAEVLDLVEGAGLRLVSFVEPARYRPETYLADPPLRARAANLSNRERWTLAEDLAGNIRKHVFYVTAAEQAAETEARPEDLSHRPVLWRTTPAELAKAAQTLRLTGDFGGLRLSFPLPRLGPAIIARMDGAATLAEISDALADAGGHVPEKVREQVIETARTLIDVGHLALSRR